MNYHKLIIDGLKNNGDPSADMSELCDSFLYEHKEVSYEEFCDTYMDGLGSRVGD